ncbi:MAG: hypothetical protein IPK16_09090 [Anaerolineales bacterium]|nr:hypothetical protein [Anaerolineales bacterium]
MVTTPEVSYAVPGAAPAPMRTSCLGRIAQILVFLWIIFVSFSNQLSSWLAAAMGSDSNPVESTFWQVAALGIRLLILAWAWRGQREQAMYRTWFAATMVLLLLAPTPWIAPAPAKSTSVAPLAILLVCLVLLRFAKLTVARSESINRNQLLLAIAGAMLFAYPWLMSGALGSVMDILLAIALGLAAGVVHRPDPRFRLVPNLRARPATRRRSL